MNRFIIADPKKCIGCRTCEVACVLAHNGGRLEALNKANFAPRLKVVKGLNVSTAIMCRHCEDAPCANVCPNGAIVRAADSIQVLQEKCIGCKTCVVACPYGAMSVVTKQVEVMFNGLSQGFCLKAEAQKCDLCEGQAAGPACISVCPTQALHMIGRDTMQAMLRKKQMRAALDEANEMSF